MKRPLALLVVEDSEDDALLLVRELERGGYAVRWERVQTAADTADALRRGDWELVVSDYAMPGFTGTEALEIVKASGLDLPFIMVSGSLSEEEAVGALRAGAHDFVVKGRLARLLPAVERELREAELRRRHREVESSLGRSETLRVLGQLAAGIAHDLRNIFTPLLLHTRLLRRRVQPDPQVLAALDTIDQVLHVGVEVVERLGLLSRKDDRGGGPTAPVTAARSAVELCRHRTRALPGVQLELEDAPGPAVGASEGELTSALLNVIVNALDAVGAQGRVCVRTGAAADGGAYVEVVDDGPGMPPEVQRRLFEPFFTTKNGGTGLGLSIVHAFVTGKGGRVTVESAPGEGTRVRMWFPAVEAASATGVAAAR